MCCKLGPEIEVASLSSISMTVVSTDVTCAQVMVVMLTCVRRRHWQPLLQLLPAVASCS